MLVSRLLRSLLRFLSPGIVPEEGGGAPAPDATPSADPTPHAGDAPAGDAPAPDAPAGGAKPEKDEPADPFAGLNAALEAVSADSAKEPTKPEPTPAPKAAPTAAPKPGEPPAKKDEIDLTPPEGMTERAQQRWSQLTERAKLVPELERRATEATTQLQSVRELVNGSGLNAQEFTDFMETARLFKQGDAKALQVLDGLRADLATRLGVEVAGVDPLAAHADLKADVESMTLTKERALEIARGRDAQKRLEGVSAGEREVQEFERTVQAASADMMAALKTREGTPGHEHRWSTLVAQLQQPGKMHEFVTTYQPQQWKATLLWMYDNIPVPAAPAPLPGPQPLRPGGRAPGAPVRTGPATAESAVMSAFDKAGL